MKRRYGTAGVKPRAVGILLAGLSTVPTCALAQNSPSEQPQSDVKNEIVVTGSRISGANATAGLPVDIYTSNAIARSGAATLEELLRNKPGFTGGALNSGTSFFGTNETGRTIGVSEANLRGIGAAYTLVLLNGRRFGGVDPADLSALPISALQSVEVLKDGASAVYGSDAVAGVINIISKRAQDGGSLAAETGITTRGDAAQYRLSGSYGASIGDLSLFVAGEYFNRNGLRYRDRSRSRDGDYTRFDSRAPIRGKGYTNPARIYLDGSDTAVALDQSRFGPGGISRNAADFVPFSDALYSAQDDINDLGNVTLITPQERSSIFASGEYKVSDSATIFADILYTDSKVTYMRDAWGIDFFSDGRVEIPAVAADNYWNPFGVEVRAVQYALLEIGQSYNLVDRATVRTTAGIRGKIGSLRYELGGAYFRVNSRFTLLNYPSAPGLAAAISRPGAASLNPFCNGCNTAAQIEGVRADPGTVRNRDDMLSFDARLSGKLFTLPGGDVKFATGAEYRRERLNQAPSQNILDGELQYVFFDPFALSRDVKSAYAELGIPIVGGDFNIPGIAELSFGGAVRYEKISNVGSTVDPRVSLIWKPIRRGFLLRASYGTSFRAPSLEVLGAGQQRSVDLYRDPVDGIIKSFNVLTGGNPDLKPETADYWNFGAVVTPVSLPGLRLSFDYYWLNQRGVVISSAPQDVLDGIAPGEVFQEPGEALQTIVATAFNAAGRKVEGVDFNADYTMALGDGSLNVGVAGSYVTHLKVDTANGQGYVDYAGGFVRTGLDFTGGIPRWRGNVNAGWSGKHVSIGYTLNFAGSYLFDFTARNAPPDALPVVLRSGNYITHDIQASLNVGNDFERSGFTLTLGVEDLTDTKLPFVVGFGDEKGFDANVANARGRFIYARVTKRF